MKKNPALLLSIGILCAAFFSCGDLKKDAILYNEKIVSLQEKITVEMLALGALLRANDFAAVDQKYPAMMKTIESVLAEARSIGPFDGNSQYRDAALNLFEFYQEIIAKQYTEIIEILKKGSGGLTDANRERLKAISEEISAREQDLDARLLDAQKAFTTRYKIILLENQLQEQLKPTGKENKQGT